MLGFPALSLPRLQQLVDDRIELLLRRLPGLQQIVIDIDDVDRRDGGVGVGVRGEQRPACLRNQIHGLLEEVDAVHPRHAIVGQDRRHLLAAQHDFPDRLQRFLARVGPHDPIVRAVSAAQIAGHRTRHARVVVDGEQYGPRRTLRSGPRQLGHVMRRPCRDSTNASAPRARPRSRLGGRLSEHGRWRAALVRSRSNRCGHRSGSGEDGPSVRRRRGNHCRRLGSCWALG